MDFLLNIWRKTYFKFSIEYWWVKLFNKLGKNLTKMDFPSVINKLIIIYFIS